MRKPIVGIMIAASIALVSGWTAAADVGPGNTEPVQASSPGVVESQPSPTVEAGATAPSEDKVVPEKVVPEKSVQEQFEALPRFGASLFATARAETPDPGDSNPDVPGAKRVSAGAAAAPDPGAGNPDVPGAKRVSAGAAAANMPVPPTYLIGPGDSLTLTVWAGKRQQIGATVTVTAEGLAAFPQVGQLSVAGQTLAQLRAAVDKSYNEYYSNPTVTLVIAEQRIVEVYVTGDAVWPGRYTLSGMASALTALYAAGGPSEIGSYRGLLLTRPGHPSVTFDLYSYLLEGRRDQDLPLQPGDSIFVPPLQTEAGVSGEVRRAGRYELLPGATVADVLKMAGGLKPSAYAPQLQLWRADEHRQWQLRCIDCSTPDAPDLQTLLQDGDLLVARPILAESVNTVQVTGAVRRPGYYPVQSAPTVAAALEAAQGPANNAHLPQALLKRLGPDLHYQVSTFDLGQALAGGPAGNITLQPHDILDVLSQEDVEPLRQVQIIGCVAHPGPYDWAKGMRVSQLLLQAGGPLDGAYMQRAELLRLTPEQTREVIRVDLAAVAAGDAGVDWVLERSDILNVATQEESRPPALVRVEGYVRKPGIYSRREGMRISDLLFAAGGPHPAAGPTIEVTSGHFEGTPRTVRAQLVVTPQEWRVEPDVVLADDDSISVMGRGEFNTQARLVHIDGLVQTPGAYPLAGHSVAELLQAAGGTLEDADADAIVLYRHFEAAVGENQAADLGHMLQTVNQQAQPHGAEPAPSSVAGTGSVSAISVSQPPAAEPTGNVAASLASLIESPNALGVVIPPRPVSTGDWVEAIPVTGPGASGTNLRLEEGDQVVIPRQSHTVMVLGAVARNGSVPFIEGTTCRRYLNASGWLREDAATDHMIVIHANGSTERLRVDAQVRAGDIVVVPTRYVVRTIRTDAGQSWLQSIASIAAGLIFR